MNDIKHQWSPGAKQFYLTSSIVYWVDFKADVPPNPLGQLNVQLDNGIDLVLPGKIVSLLLCKRSQH